MSIGACETPVLLCSTCARDGIGYVTTCGRMCDLCRMIAQPCADLRSFLDMRARFDASRILPHASSATSPSRGDPGCRPGVFQPLRLRTTLPQLVHEVRVMTTGHALWFVNHHHCLEYFRRLWWTVGIHGLRCFVFVRSYCGKKRQVVSHAFGAT